MSPALPAIRKLLFHGDEEVLKDACWCLRSISEEGEQRIQAVIDADVCGRLVMLLLHGSAKVGGREGGPEGEEACPQIVTALPQVQAPALRAISNILSGSESQTLALVVLGVLPPLLSLLSHDNQNIRKDCAFALSNITAESAHIEVSSVCDAVAIIRYPCTALTRAHSSHVTLFFFLPGCDSRRPRSTSHQHSHER